MVRLKANYRSGPSPEGSFRGQRAVGYVRVSTEEQAKGGASIEAQKDYLRAWAERDGMVLVNIYADPGFSGKDTNRPGLQQLLEDARHDKFDLLLLYHNDRLSRDTRDALQIVDDLFQSGVRTLLGNFNMDITTAEGEMMFTQLSAFATYFRQDLSRKTKAGMARRNREGIRAGAVSKYFTRNPDRTISLVDRRVLEMERLRKKGTSLREIARLMKLPGRYAFKEVDRALKCLTWYREHQGQ